MDNIRHYIKWKDYQKDYVRKHRDKMNAYGRNYYQTNKEKFKEYYSKYKKKKEDEKNGIINETELKIKKDKYLRALEREKRKNERILEKARDFREQLRSSGVDPNCLGTF
jgi:hypothetical protein